MWRNKWQVITVRRIQPQQMLEVLQQKKNAATLRETVDKLKNGNPIEKAKAVLTLKREVADLKENAGELRGTVQDVRRDVDGDPLNYLFGLIPGLLTGLLHRRFAH